MLHNATSSFCFLKNCQIPDFLLLTLPLKTVNIRSCTFKYPNELVELII